MFPNSVFVDCMDELNSLLDKFNHLFVPVLSHVFFENYVVSAMLIQSDCYQLKF